MALRSVRESVREKNKFINPTAVGFDIIEQRSGWDDFGRRIRVGSLGIEDSKIGLQDW